MTRAWSAPTAPLGQRIDMLTGNQQPVPALADDFLEVSSGSELGFVQRRVFVNAASSRVGTLVGPTVAEPATTISTPEQLGPGRIFQITTCPASPGAGGGEAVSGASASPVFGSTGPGGSARGQRLFSRAELLAALPITISVGLGGLGSVGAVSSTSTIILPTPGNAPSQNFASFGNLLRSFCGGTGRARTSTGGANICGGGGGGWEGPGQPAASTTAVDGGPPLNGISGTLEQNGSIYGGGAALNNTPNSGKSFFGGAAGGTAASTVGSSTPGGAAPYGGGGGGLGGRAANAVVTGPGLAGGSTSSIPGGTGGGSNGDGGNGTDSAWPETSMGGSGGGGAPGVGASPTGGNGGRGGFPGGAPGGGGPASGSAGTATGGNGGDGADGCVVLVALC